MPITSHLITTFKLEVPTIDGFLSEYRKHTNGHSAWLWKRYSAFTHHLSCYNQCTKFHTFLLSVHAQSLHCCYCITYVFVDLMFTNAFRIIATNMKCKTKIWIILITPLLLAHKISIAIIITPDLCFNASKTNMKYPSELLKIDLLSPWILISFKNAALHCKSPWYCMNKVNNWSRKNPCGLINHQNVNRAALNHSKFQDRPVDTETPQSVHLAVWNSMLNE